MGICVCTSADAGCRDAELFQCVPAMRLRQRCAFHPTFWSRHLWVGILQLPALRREERLDLATTQLSVVKCGAERRRKITIRSRVRDMLCELTATATHRMLCLSIE